jgi:valyl-tRNA synthetase
MQQLWQEQKVYDCKASTVAEASSYVKTSADTMADKPADTSDIKTFLFAKTSMDGQKLFSIDTPPPTVSGSLHVGHVFFYICIFFVLNFLI